MRLSGCGWHDARIRYEFDTRPRSHRWETYCQIVPVQTSKIAKSLICLGFFQNISKSHEHLQPNRINHLRTHAIRVHERESMTEATPDLVARLRSRREFASLDGSRWYTTTGPDRDCAEAAEEIERLRERLRELAAVPAKPKPKTCPYKDGKVCGKPGACMSPFCHT